MERFDVFLSHRSEDDETIVRIATILRDASIEPWIDNWYCEGGGRWQTEIADGIKNSRAFAVFLGASGMSGWVDEELAVALSRAAKDRDYRVFLVLLPQAPDPFDRSTLPAFLNTRGSVDLRKGYERTDQIRALTDAILGIVAGPPPKPDQSDTSPYRGLEAFDEEHAAFYFGRSAEIQHLIEKLKGSRFLAVVGPSGSGKSSLVRAGLIPALREGRIPGSEHWVIGKMRPGSHPLAALATELVRVAPDLAMGKTVDELRDDPRALDHIARLVIAGSPAGSKFLLVVDQFEELFTLCQDDAERSAFIAALLYAATIPGGECLVVVTLRADFYARCATYPELAALIAGQQTLVWSLDDQNLRDVIVEPAWRSGLHFEDGLVDTIQTDVANQPGSLPLLEHALQGLWQNRRGSLLTLEGYQASGRVAGSIAKTAEAEYTSLDPEQQALARSIFLRLTQPGEGTEDTRRRASVDELVPEASDSASIEAVIDRLIAARLLTASTSESDPGRSQIEVAHEALIRAWPRLRTWIDEDRIGLRIHRRLADDALEWQRMGYDEAQLYRGAKLVEASDYAERQPASLNALERSFLDQSAALRDRERAEANARRAARERNQKRVAAGLFAGLVISLLLGGFGWLQRTKALDESHTRATAVIVAQQESADRQAAELTAVAEAQHAQTAQADANAEAVRATEAQGLAEANAQTAQAESLSRATAEANSALEAANALAAQATAQANADLAEAQRQEAVRQSQIAEQNRRDSNARELAAIGASDNLRIDQSLLIDIEALHTSSDVVDPYLVPKVLERDPRFLKILTPPNPSLGLDNDFCMLKDGRVIAALGRDDSIYLWDANTGELTNTLGGGGVNTSLAGRLACQKHGALAATSAGPDAAIELWDIDAGKQAGQIDLGSESTAGFAFLPNSDLMVIWETNGLKFWNVSKQKEELPFWFGSTEAPLTPSSATFNEDGSLLAIGDAAGNLQIWNVHTGKTVQDTTKVASGELGPIRLSPDGKLIALSIDGTQLALLKLGAGEQAVTLKDFSSAVGQQIADIAFSPDGHWLAATTLDGQITLIDLTSSNYSEAPPIKPLPEGSGGWGLLFRPDEPNVLASISGDGSISLWDLEGAGAIATTLPGFNGFAAGMAVSPDSKTLAIIDCQGQVSLWDLEQMRSLGNVIDGPSIGNCPGTRQSVAFSQDGKFLAAGFLDGSIRVYELANHAMVHQYPGAGSTIMTLGFSSGDSMLVSLDESGELSFWNLSDSSEKAAYDVKAHDSAIFASALSPDSRLLVTSATEDSAIKVWDLEHPGQWSELPSGGPDSTLIAALMFDGADSHIVAVDVFGQVVSWTKDGDTWTREMLEPNQQVGAVIASLAVGDHLEARLTTLDELGLYDADGAQVFGVRLSSSATAYGVGLILTPDGKHLISGHSDRVIVWDLDPAAWSATACQIAGRNLSAEEWAKYFPNQPYRRTCSEFPEGFGVESSATPVAATPVPS